MPREMKTTRGGEEGEDYKDNEDDETDEGGERYEGVEDERAPRWMKTRRPQERRHSQRRPCLERAVSQKSRNTTRMSGIATCRPPCTSLHAMVTKKLSQRCCTAEQR